MNGILLVNKESDWTSFDVIAKLRGVLKERKIGHTGTLDPLATGLLVIMLGGATKAIDLIPDHDKEYVAGFRLGVESNTEDISGELKAISDKKVSKAEVESALEKFSGKILQIPPMFSAVKINGTKLYKLAYKGEEIERAAKEIEVFETRLLDFNEEKREGTVFFSVSKGTYVRTLLSDMGKNLEVGAVMTSLKRTRANGFSIEGAKTISEIEKNGADILPLEQAFSSFQRVDLNEETSKRLKNGAAAQSQTLNGIYRVYFENSFLGLASVSENEIRVKKFF